MVPLLRFYFHEEVRSAAMSILPELLRSAKLASEKGVPGANAQVVKQLLDFVWQPLMEAMAKVELPYNSHSSGSSCCLEAVVMHCSLHMCLHVVS